MKSHERFHALEEHVAGRWQLASIPMETAAADQALNAARVADPSRRLRLVPAAPITPASPSKACGEILAAAAAIFRDCCKRAA